MSYASLHQKLGLTPDPIPGHGTSDFSPREFDIVECVVKAGFPLTDRDVAILLKRPDMNEVRPSITRLIQRGELREVSVKRCPVSGRRVRTVEST